ncbi:hypothetical protein K503DRAFT_600813 [Rhizopogon vinicolor AM-OR11-026]|uniref:Uncharacterized protein n=1 Tax=Rhizopogon vinicolor AM-OR11-026 TaxID=1314800 RepID=A0A1B7MIT3_9AGAM|nr:hypothetical protein K503DRAFT_600813 [Rhizopogon vinicolor AM-OR11-026]
MAQPGHLARTRRNAEFALQIRRACQEIDESCFYGILYVHVFFLFLLSFVIVFILLKFPTHSRATLGQKVNVSYEYDKFLSLYPFFVSTSILNLLC